MHSCSFAQAVFMYWIPNNLISLAQTRVLKTESLKRSPVIPLSELLLTVSFVSNFV